MSPGSATHNASTTALTRAAASSPPSGTHMARDSTERYATNADSRGRTRSPLKPKRLRAEPDRMRAPDGQNTGVRRELKAASARRLEGGLVVVGLVRSAVLFVARVAVAGRIMRRTRPVMLRTEVEIRDHGDRELGHRRRRDQRRQTPCDDKGCHD